MLFYMLCTFNRSKNYLVRIWGCKADSIKFSSWNKCLAHFLYLILEKISLIFYICLILRAILTLTHFNKRHPDIYITDKCLPSVCQCELCLWGFHFTFSHRTLTKLYFFVLFLNQRETLHAKNRQNPTQIYFWVCAVFLW